MKEFDNDLNDYIQRNGGLRAICQLEEPDKYLASQGLYHYGILNISELMLRTNIEF